MPVWLLPLLIKFVLPIVLKVLEKTGCVNAAEKLAIKAGTKIIEVAESVEIEPDFPPQNARGQR
jgi:hypothetical protein